MSGSLVELFKRGTTLCHFQILGKVEDIMDKLMICAMMGAIFSDPTLTVLVSMKSTPVAVEFLRPFTSLSTYSLSTKFSWN